MIVDQLECFLWKLFFATPPCGPWPPHSPGFYNTHNDAPQSVGLLYTHNDAPQSVGLLWTSDELVAETSTWQHTTLTKDGHPCPR